MGKPKHTPGPWRIYRQGNHIRIGPDFGHVVAVVYLDKDFLDTDRADAELISAAPELLEALEIAVKFFNNNGGDADYTWLPVLKAAIAKAKGK